MQQDSVLKILTEVEHKFSKAITIKTLEFVPEDIDQAAQFSNTIDITGLMVWPASSFLCEYIIKNRKIFKKQKVVELGAGCGIGGLVAAKYASEVLITDGNELVMQAVRENIDKNPSRTCNIRSLKLKWGQEDSSLMQQFPIIIASDVVYKTEFFIALFNTVKNLLAPGSDSKFILGFAKRFPTLETYIEKAATEAQLRLVKVEEFKYSELNIQNLLIRDDTERVYIHTYGHFTQI
jgi:predicted nicotinamide N-methyase